MQLRSEHRVEEGNSALRRDLADPNRCLRQPGKGVLEANELVRQLGDRLRNEGGDPAGAKTDPDAVDSARERQLNRSVQLPEQEGDLTVFSDISLDELTPSQRMSWTTVTRASLNAQLVCVPELDATGEYLVDLIGNNTGYWNQLDGIQGKAH